MPAELDAGIESFFHLEFELKDEIAVFFIGRKEGIDIPCDSGGDDASVFNREGGFSGHLMPSAQVLAVEKGFPLGAACGKQEYCG